MLKRKTWIPTLAITALFVGALAGCSSKETTSSPSKKIHIVAAEDFYGEVAQAVGGNHVEVKSIINSPTQDPHEYEATTNDSKAVADSQLIIYNGIGYDAWMEKILKSNTSTTKKTIAVTSDLLGKQEGDNEHVWYNPETMPKLAKKIADDLASIDPSNANDYQKRADSYINELAPLQSKINKLKQTSTTPIDVSEPIFDYMASALNLDILDPKFAQAINEGTDPSPTDIGKIQDDIKYKKIRFFVNNVQNTSSTVGNLVKQAKDNNIPVIDVTETKPNGKTYIQWMSDILDQVEKAISVH